jgi:hypothetical protein
MSDARVDRIAHTNVSSCGERATHFSLCCGSCGNLVGRTYTEVPAGVSLIQNLFCLEVNRCISYELGSSEMRAAASDPAADALHQRQQQLPQGQQQFPGSENGSQGPGMDSPLMLDLLQRLEHLEASLCTVRASSQCVHRFHYPALTLLAAAASPPPCAAAGHSGTA